MAATAAPASALAGHGRAVHRRGGHVGRAWPARGGRGRPAQPLARWLARQVGPIRPRHRPRRHHGHSRRHSVRFSLRSAAAAPGRRTPALKFSSTGLAQPLRLIRSYSIPVDDPSATRLANLSWTYDSALAATAFSELGDSAQAQQLLDQLAALQRSDGSIDFAFDTLTGQSVPLLRSGTVAWLGLAAARYRAQFCSSRYDSVAVAAARWLLARQVSNRSSAAFGLLTGGPDVTWAATQHNLLARGFLNDFAKLIDGNAGEERSCAGGLAGQSAASAAALSRQLHASVTQIDAGVSRALVVRGSGGEWFRAGAGDDVRPLDVQALGILWLIGQGRHAEAATVRATADATMLLAGRAISLSSAPDSYNETYHALGPFAGYRPYADAGSPDVLWMEGTLEMRLALGAVGASTATVDPSIAGWLAITGTSGPLQANRAVTTSAFNEYHVWPASAAASWALLDVTPFAAALE